MQKSSGNRDTEYATQLFDVAHVRLLIIILQNLYGQKEITEKKSHICMYIYVCIYRERDGSLLKVIKQN